jgi:hypothetical protein
MKEQILQFRQILDRHNLSIDDFELNVDGETFRLLIAGEPAEVEVLCRSSQTTRAYRCDGTAGWLEAFTKDLEAAIFIS